MRSAHKLCVFWSLYFCIFVYLYICLFVCLCAYYSTDLIPLHCSELAPVKPLLCNTYYSTEMLSGVLREYSVLCGGGTGNSHITHCVSNLCVFRLQTDWM